MTITTEKPAEFEFEGEFLDVDASLGYQLKAKMEQAAKALHAAKAEAFAVEAEIKQVMRGFENLRVDGEVIATWKWVDATEFQKKLLMEQFPDIYAKFVVKVKNKTRRFNFKTVVGVD